MTLGDTRIIEGSEVVQAFLRELHGFVCGCPGGSVEAKPDEIVEMVIIDTDRFACASDSCAETLSHQLGMAIKGRHNRYGLKFAPIGAGRVRVWV